MITMASKDSIMCPSHRCKSGSQLLGVRQENGVVAILPQTIAIDDDFIKAAGQNEVPAEQRFRFTNKCIESGCKQWNGRGCNVAERVVEFLHKIPIAETLVSCSIRNSCRWYMQKGSDACKICPYVLTEITEGEFLTS
jgi:hypothetical protein